MGEEGSQRRTQSEPKMRLLKRSQPFLPEIESNKPLPPPRRNAPSHHTQPTKMSRHNSHESEVPKRKKKMSFQNNFALKNHGINGKPDNLPVVLLVGFLNSCEKEMKGGVFYNSIVKANQKNGFPQNKIYCLNYLTSPFGYINSILETLCTDIKAKEEKWGLRDGFMLVGLSQGGLFARHILQACSTGQFAKRLMTVGTPNSGMSKVPVIMNPYFQKFVKVFTDSAILSAVVRKGLIQANFFRSPHIESKWINEAPFIAHLNNEAKHEDPKIKEQYKKRIEQLEGLILASFKEDDFIYPNTSQQFGFYCFSDSDTHKTGEETEAKECSLKEMKDFNSNPLGLKTLYHKGKITNIELKGKHLEFSTSSMDKLVPYFHHNIYVNIGGKKK